ncbi:MULTISPECIES: DUF1905 domain-containing protein [unclassified Gordonia (in: high G+C Gram-positive bacteria)]
MGDVLRLTTRLEPRGPAAAVILTDDEVASLGAGKTPPVAFTIAGTTVQGRIGRMGGENLLGFNKAVRTQLGVAAGDTVDIEITLDAGPREVEVPPALAEALDADPAAKKAFAALAPSRRKEMVRSVADAKKDDTRARRVAAALAQLAH